MILGVVENIWDFLYKVTNSNLTLDLLLYISIGFITLMVLFFIVKSYYAYEGRLERSLSKINRWLFVHQQIDETNLVEFNMLIKKAPRLLRYHWQQYMLYREHEPSNYLSVYNCIDKPLHTSSYTANIKNFMNICIATMLTVFTLSLIYHGSNAINVSTFATSLIAPVVIIILSVIFIILLRAMQNFNLASLYQNFHLFNRYIDKASSTIPKYVDFEILFTRKEIRGGIPVLNEYLEKRARQEAEELERARQNAVEHETYDFSALGIDGSLVIERAIKESEIFLNARQRLLTEIQHLESEKDSSKRNYENVSKEYQRKLQASKENVERLRQQQEESTNRIEVNYIRKQQQDEIKKQEQLEKDQDDATLRHNQEISALTEEIAKKREELDSKRSVVFEAMFSEYQTFADKVYKGIVEDTAKRHKEEVKTLADQRQQLVQELEKSKEINLIKDEVITDLRNMIEKQADKEKASSEALETLKPNTEEVAAITTKTEEPTEAKAEELTEAEAEEPTEAEESTEAEAEGYYDSNGYYWFPNGTYYDDKGLYHDEVGDIYDADGNLIALAQNANFSDETQEDKELNVKEEITFQETPVVLEEISETVEKQTDKPSSFTEEKQEEKPEEEDKKEEKPVAKKRGRPKGSTAAKKVTGKRGRPRKVVTDEEQVKPAAKKRGRPRKVVTDEEQVNPVAKKRGRPRKVVTDEEQVKPAAKKRGRPRKVITDEEQVKPAAKKRGRPRKVVTEDLQNISDLLIEESNRLMEQQTELNRQLGETLLHIKEQDKPTDDKPTEDK